MFFFMGWEKCVSVIFTLRAKCFSVGGLSVKNSKNYSWVLDTNDAKEHGKIAPGLVYDMKHKIAEKVIDSLLCASFIT